MIDRGDGNGLDIRTIMQNGQDAGRASPILGGSSPDKVKEEDWTVPEALHVKMYALGVKYGIEKLVETSVDELATELSWNADPFVPSLEYLFSRPEFTGPPTEFEAEAGAEAQDESEDDEEDDKKAQLQPQKQKDGKLWKLLISTAAKHIAKYKNDKDFRAVAMKNAAFQWDLLKTVSEELEEVQKRCSSMTQTADAPKPKRTGRKRKSDLISQASDEK